MLFCGDGGENLRGWGGHGVDLFVEGRGWGEIVSPCHSLIHWAFYLCLYYTHEFYVRL